ncbi:Monogalactosyldiacylglycerol synthase 1, chloroplastic [Asimina triloba]
MRLVNCNHCNLGPSSIATSRHLKMDEDLSFEDITFHVQGKLVLDPITSKLRYLGGEVEHVRVDWDRFAYMDLQGEVERITAMDFEKLMFQYRRLDKDSAGLVMTEIKNDWSLFDALQSNDVSLNIYVSCIEPCSWEPKACEKSTGYTGEHDSVSSSDEDEIHVARGGPDMTNLDEDTTNAINRELGDLDYDSDKIPQTDPSDVNRKGSKSTSQAWIADDIECRLRINGNLTVGQIMGNLLLQYGLTVGYHKSHLDNCQVYVNDTEDKPRFIGAVEAESGSSWAWFLQHERMQYDVDFISIYDVDEVIFPPEMKKKPGRPKTKRHMSADEKQNKAKRRSQGNTVHCSLCRKLGHIKRSCKSSLATGQASSSSHSEAKKSRRRASCCFHYSMSD